MKNFIRFLVFVLTLSTLSVHTFAAEKNQTVSFEEYAKAIEAEYAKYGVEGGVYEPEGEFFCTIDTLEQDLNIVRQRAKSIAAAKISSPIQSCNSTASAIEPQGMITTTTMTDTYFYKDLSHPIIPYSCTIKTTVVITSDYQNAHIISVSKPELEITKGIGIDDWIEYVSHSTSINQEKKSAQQTIVCKVKEEISLGAITSWEKVEVTYIASFKNIPC